MNTEQLAEELHKFYRAAFKALHGTTRPIGQFQCDAPGHDHGWDHCNKKQYFRRRAEMLREAGLSVTPTIVGVAIDRGYCGKCGNSLPECHCKGKR